MQLYEYTSYDAIGLGDLIRRKEVSPKEVGEAAIAASNAVNPAINALIETWPDEGPTSQANPDSPFFGVPFLVKDLGVSVAGRLNELGSKIAEGLKPSANSTLMMQFRRSGLAPVGRTTTPEFGISTTTEAVFCGPTRNPWNTEHSAGGSSGGSGAAVAAGVTPLAHATDGGGSIRIPASANGIFGLKPTRGRVSNGPVVDEIWSGFVVQLGVSRTVRDSAALLDIAQGGGVGEPYLTNKPEFTYLSQVKKDPRPLKIGVMKDPANGRRSAAAVASEVMRTAALCENLGHKVEPVDFNSGVSWEAFVFANAQIWTANTTAWIDVIAQITGRVPNAENLEPVTRAAYEYGKRASALDLLGALDVRNTVSRALAAFFQSYDLLLTPTLPDVPALIGQLYEGTESLDGLGWVDRVFTNSPFTALANVSGVPAMSVPLGVDSATGLPIGSQFFAPFGDEATLFSLAGQLERASPWIERHPAVWAGAQL